MSKTFFGDAEEIYKLELHDIWQNNGLEVIRVPGGFLYRYWDYQKQDYYEHVTFVPYDNEFDPARKGYIQPSARDNPMPNGLP